MYGVNSSSDKYTVVYLIIAKSVRLAEDVY